MIAPPSFLDLPFRLFLNATVTHSAYCLKEHNLVLLSCYLMMILTNSHHQGVCGKGSGSIIMIVHLLSFVCLFGSFLMLQ